MSKNIRIAAALATALVVTVVTKPAGAQPVPAPVRRAMGVLTSHGKMILSVAYPTVDFEAVDGCEARTTSLVVCTFRYQDFLNGRTRQNLAFQLDKNGFVTAIANAGGEDWLEPFTTAVALQSGFVQAAREDLARGRYSDADMRALLELVSNSPPPQVILAFLLNCDIKRLPLA